MMPPITLATNTNDICNDDATTLRHVVLEQQQRLDKAFLRERFYRNEITKMASALETSTSATSNEEESAEEESKVDKNEGGWISATSTTGVNSHHTTSSHLSLSRSIKEKEQQVEVLHMMHQLSCSRMEAQSFQAQRDKLYHECDRLEGILVEQKEYISRLELQKELIQADASTAASTSCFYCPHSCSMEESSSSDTTPTSRLRNACTQTEEQCKPNTQFVSSPLLPGQDDEIEEQQHVSEPPKQHSIGRRLLCSLSGTPSTCPVAYMPLANKDRNTTPIKTNCTSSNKAQRNNNRTTNITTNRTTTNITTKRTTTPITLLQQESCLYLQEELTRMQESHFGEMRHKDIQIAYLRQELAKQRNGSGNNRMLLSI